MKALDALRTITDLLSSQRVEEPEATAKVIITHVLGDINYFAELSDNDWGAILNMANSAGSGVPVEYVTGKAYFRYLELNVSPDVLIPRKETELVAGAAIELIKSKGYKTALDMCTGSGCIAVSLATETDSFISAADISMGALNIAVKNAEENNAKVEFLQSDMFQNIDSEYDMIVCNPPYISTEEYETLSNDVKEHEPKNALVAGDGLEFYRIIAKDAPGYLRNGGALVLEIGAYQAEDVKFLLEENDFEDIKIRKDYQGRDRIVLALKGR